MVWRYHADVTYTGGGWSIYLNELDETVRARHRGEIASRALDFILSKPGAVDAEIDIRFCSERDVIRSRAAQMGFDRIVQAGGRVDTYQPPAKTKSVSVEYDRQGAVVGIDASARNSAFEVSRGGALDALFSTAQYVDSTGKP